MKSLRANQAFDLSDLPPLPPSPSPVPLSRSRRIGQVNNPHGPNFSMPFLPASTPPLPTRSPLRPTPTRANVNDYDSVFRPPRSSKTPPPTRSPPPIPEGVAGFPLTTRLIAETKPLPPSPDPSTASPAPGTNASTPPFSKRKHALLELLSSERAFASDLALVRDIHIPLAMGQSTGFSFPTLSTPPASSSSSTRTASTQSDPPSNLGPPMSKEDIRTIFGNIEDLAQFADFFSEKLETALGEVLEGGSGKDAVGALFLEVIPVMTPHYTTYITRHPTALAHFQTLSASPSPSFSAYLTQTRDLVASHTHAWDLPSLLIKPVQRLLKYPLLLTAIIDDTPDNHGDKEKLQIARQNMEEAARGVNEGRRRWEVVKGVLDGTGKTLNSPALNTVGRMRSFRIGGKIKGLEEEEGSDIAGLEEMEKRLKAYEKLMKTFGREVMAWIHAVRATIMRLREWSERFGLVLGVGVDSQSDALSAFNEVLEERLLSLCDDLESTLLTSLLPALKRLSNTIGPPLLLIATMDSLRPSHIAFLNIPVAKSKTSAALMQASMSYQALYAQLKQELPTYLNLLEKGFGATITQFAAWQEKFWEETHARWSELWVALEINSTDASGEETVRVWWSRFEEAELDLKQLQILNRQLYKSPLHAKSSSSSVLISPPPSIQSHSIPAIPSPPIQTPMSALHPAFIPDPIPHTRSQSLGDIKAVKHTRSRTRSGERSPPTERPSGGQLVRGKDAFDDWIPISPHIYGSTRIPQDNIRELPGSARMKSEPVQLRAANKRANVEQPRDSGYQESRESMSSRTMISRESQDSGLVAKVERELGALNPQGSRYGTGSIAGGTSRTKKTASLQRRLTDGLRSADYPDYFPPKKQERQDRRRKQTIDDDIVNSSSKTSEVSRVYNNGAQDKKGSVRIGNGVRKTDLDARRRSDEDHTYRRNGERDPDLVYRKPPDHDLVRRYREPLATMTATWDVSPDSLPILCHCIIIQNYHAPPSNCTYQSFPFLSLHINDLIQIIFDGGHPSSHAGLPIEFDDAEPETLFLIKDAEDRIGWALASYMLPVV